MPGTQGKVAELILLTGLRWGEAVAVRREDIDGDVLHVRRTQTKGGRSIPPKTTAGRRVVPLSTRAREILTELDFPIGGDYSGARDALVTAMGDLHQPGMGWPTSSATPTPASSTGRGCPSGTRRPGWGTAGTSR